MIIKTDKQFNILPSHIGLVKSHEQHHLRYTLAHSCRLSHKASYRQYFENFLTVNALAIRCLRMSKLGRHCFPNLGVFGQSV